MPVRRAYRVGLMQVLLKSTVHGMNISDRPVTHVPPLTSVSHPHPSLPGNSEVLETR